MNFSPLPARWAGNGFSCINGVFGFMLQDGSAGSARSVEKIEKWIFYFLCGYALCSSISMGGANVCLGLATVGMIIRLIKKHDDWRELIIVDKGLRLPFLIFLGVLVVTNIFTLNMEATAKNMFQYYINNFEPFLLAVMFVRKRDWLIKIVGLMVASSVINNIYVIYQWLSMDTGARGSQGFFRIMSTAGLLSMMVPTVALLMLNTQGKLKWGMLVGLLINAMGAVSNNTRGAWVAIAVTVVVTTLLMVKSKVKALVALLVLAIGLSVVVCHVPAMYMRVQSMTNVTDNRSNMERLYLWQSATNMGNDYPLTGVGSGNFGDMYHEKYILPEAKMPHLGHTHNLFFQEFAEHGYPGGIAFLIWVLGTIAYCIRGWHKEKKTGYIFMLAIFMGLMINGLTEHTFSHPIVMKWFWFGMGISYRWIKVEE